MFLLQWMVLTTHDLLVHCKELAALEKKKVNSKLYRNFDRGNCFLMSVSVDEHIRLFVNPSVSCMGQVEWRRPTWSAVACQGAHVLKL